VRWKGWENVWRAKREKAKGIPESQPRNSTSSQGEGRGFATRGAQFLGEEDDTFPSRKALFGIEDSDDGYL
jgi:hypothetical protein